MFWCAKLDVSGTLPLLTRDMGMLCMLQDAGGSFHVSTLRSLGDAAPPVFCGLPRRQRAVPAPHVFAQSGLHFGRWWGCLAAVCVCPGRSEANSCLSGAGVSESVIVCCQPFSWVLPPLQCMAGYNDVSLAYDSDT